MYIKLLQSGCFFRHYNPTSTSLQNVAFKKVEQQRRRSYVNHGVPQHSIIQSQSVCYSVSGKHSQILPLPVTCPLWLKVIGYIHLSCPTLYVQAMARTTGPEQTLINPSHTQLVLYYPIPFICSAHCIFETSLMGQRFGCTPLCRG